MKTKSIALELKSLDDDGTFSGYGSVFEVKDHGGDIVEKGAFGASLEAWKKSGRSVPTLWQHKTSEPIGSWPDLAEDDYGLLGKSALWLEEAPYARIAHKGMKTKTITGLSIGYRVKRESFDKKANANRLHELDLAEISVVTDPMNDMARVADVKTICKDGELPTLRQFEDFLRDSGFSKSQAVTIASRGLGEMLKRSDSAGDTGSLVEVFDLLSSFQLR